MEFSEQTDAKRGGHLHALLDCFLNLKTAEIAVFQALAFRVTPSLAVEQLLRLLEGGVQAQELRTWIGRFTPDTLRDRICVASLRFEADSRVCAIGGSGRRGNFPHVAWVIHQ